MRSDRLKEPDGRLMQKFRGPDLVGQELATDQISHLKQALDEEKRKNKDLLDQLDLLRNIGGDLIKEDQGTEER